MENEFKITALCLFCQAPLEAEDNVEFESGDLIKCIACGESNDFDSVVEVAKEKGAEKIKEEFEAELNKTMGNLFK